MKDRGMLVRLFVTKRKERCCHQRFTYLHSESVFLLCMIHASVIVWLLRVVLDVYICGRRKNGFAFRMISDR